MRSVNVQDAVIGSLFTLLGVAVLYFSSGLKAMPGMVVGPGFFPQVTGAGLALFGAVLVTLSLWGRQDEAEDGTLTTTQPSEKPSLANRLFSPVLLLSILVLIVVMPILGFLVTTTLFSILVVLIGGGGLLRALIFSPVLTFATHALFVYGLRVPLPVGIWG